MQSRSSWWVISCWLHTGGYRLLSSACLGVVLVLLCAGSLAGRTEYRRGRASRNRHRGGTEIADSLVANAKRFRAVYRFNEGSSSAVRKNVKMAALM